MAVQQYKIFIVFTPLLLLALSSCNEETLKNLNRADELIPRQNTATLTITDYCPRTGFEYRDLWVVGMSYEIEQGQILFDTDRDGIPNIRESSTTLGINYANADSNSDGYSDLVIYQAGLSIQSQNALRLCADITGDVDLDGLTDCEEENLLHTDLNKFETDGDGISDYLEVRFGLNPLDPNDADQNLAFDGISNIDKIKLNLPITQSVNPSILELAYQYHISPHASGCMDISISNIPLLNISSGNEVDVFIFEQNNAGDSAQRIIPYVFEQNTLVNDEYVYSYTPGDASQWSVQQ